MSDLLCIVGPLHGQYRPPEGDHIQEGVYRYVKRRIWCEDASLMVWCPDHVMPEEILNKLRAAVALVR